MINKIILTLIVLFIGCQSQIFSVTGQDYILRPLDEINNLDIGEAYPWLSSDGYRLYFCGNQNTEELSQLYRADRSALNGSFGQPRILEVNVQGYDNLSPSLSADETQMVWVVRQQIGHLQTQIYMAERPHRNAPFSTPARLQFADDLRGELISPSLTPDLEQLYVFNLYRGQQSILRFDRIGRHVYKYTNRTVINTPYILKTGKLSTDGLEYYLSIDRKHGAPAIYIMKRPSIDVPFNEMSIYRHDVINHPEYRNHQPFFTANKKFLVFTRSGKNRWEQNDLYLATMIHPGLTGSVTGGLEDVLLYPNPTPGYLFVRNPSNVPLDIEIFDLETRLVYRKDNIHTLSELDISSLLPGMYVVHLVSNEGQVRKVTRIVRSD